MKKIIFFLALIFMASVSYLNAQNYVLGYQSLSAVAEKTEDRPATKDEFELGYCGDMNNLFGYNLPAGNSYVSGCIYFTAGQMSNYAGGTLHTIETYVFGLMNGSNACMQNYTDYTIWIKNALNGPIVYQQSVTPNLAAYNNFVLTTPYALTGEALVIGYTISFNLPAAAPRLPLSGSILDAPYPPQAYNALGTTSATGHGAGASFTGNLERALCIWGHVTADPLPANDLAAGTPISNPLKWVGNQVAFSVTVSNGGTASQNNYTVQLIDAANNILATQNVTTPLAAGASNTLTLNYTPTTAGNLAVRGKVILANDENPSNDISNPLNCKIYPMQPMAYCTTIAQGTLTAAATSIPSPVHLAIGYPAAEMGPFAGKRVTAIDVFIAAPPSAITNASVWVRDALTGTNLATQTFTAVEGWNSVTLATPFNLTSANTFIGATYTVTSTTVYPMATSNNTQNGANGGHYAIGAGTWSTLALFPPAQGGPIPGNWAIVGEVETPVNAVTITTGVNPAGAGTVTGGGTYTIGNPVTLTANANVGYTFENWTPGNSTANPLTFNAAADITYTANFSGAPPACEDIQVGTGTSSILAHNPASVYYANSYTQQIYEAAEIGYGNPGEHAYVTSIRFRFTGSLLVTAYNIANANIYLGNTSKSTFDSNTDWVPLNDLELVYQGGMALSTTANGGWTTIEFSQPFYYTGGNLVVAVNKLNTTGTGLLATTNFWPGMAGTNKSIYIAADGATPYNPASPGTGTRVNNRANAIFKFCEAGAPGDCDPATNLNITFNNSCAAVLTWEAPTGKGKDVNPMPIQKPDKMTILQDKKMRSERIANAMAKRPSKESSITKGTILFEDFENAYPPDMPTGWTVQNQSYYDWETIDWDDAYSGWQYAISFWDFDDRNEWMFTPAMALTTGTEYTLRFWVMAGYDVGDYDRLQVRIAQNPTISAMTAGTAIYTNTQLYTYDDWIQVQQTFTVPTTGNYYLGFRAYTIGIDGMDICIDDVSVTSPDGPTPSEVTYNIYRDGIIIAPNVTALTYTDAAFDYSVGHTWTVKVACEGDGESAGISKAMPACEFEPGDCDPPTDLTVTYNANCNTAQLDWKAPTGKGNVIQTPTPTQQEKGERQRGTTPSEFTRISPAQGSGISNNDFFRGPNSDVYWGDNATQWHKATLSSYPGTLLGSSGRNIQASEYVNGTLYGISYFYGNQFGTINQTNGAFTIVEQECECDAMSLCYNPTNGLTYCFQWGGGSFGTVDLATGAFTHVGNVQPPGATMIAAIDNDGVCYAIRSATPGVFGTINLANGAFTPIATLPVPATSVQEMTVDRETNEIYWAKTPTPFNVYKIDKVTGALTSVGVMPGQTYVFSAATLPPEPCAAISNLNLTTTGSSVTLTWTAAAGSPTGYRIDYDGGTLTTVTTTSYTHTGVPDGLHSYTVTALFTGSCIPFGISQTIIVGDMCMFKITMQGDYTDSWNTGAGDFASIEVKSNGITYGTATIPYDAETATAFIVVPSGTLQFIWNTGGYPDECQFQIYNADETMIYSSAPSYNNGGDGMYGISGVFFTYQNECGGSEPPVTVAYNVYRDGIKLTPTPITVTTYTAPFDNSTPHTWSVRVACEGDGESAPESVAMGTCEASPCPPVVNLTAEYQSGPYGADCKALLSWEAPGKGRNSLVDINDPKYDFTPVYTYEDKEEPAHTAVFSKDPNGSGIVTEPFDKGPNEWLKWNVSYDNNGIGNGQPIDYIVAARYTPADLVAQSINTGDMISIVRFIPYHVPGITFTIHIYQGGTSATNPGTLMHEQVVTQSVTAGVYNEVTLTTPFVINAAQELWVGYRLVLTQTAQYPAGVDAGPMVDGKGNLMYWNDAWTTMAIAGGSNNLFYNWIIEAFILPGGELCNPASNLTATQNGTNVNLSWTAAQGTPTGYEVRYDGTLLTTTPAATTTYTHNNPTQGQHTYSVRALFNSDCYPQTVSTTIMVNEVFTGGCEGAIVGTGTTTANTMPVNTFYNHSYVQHIYLESELSEHIGKEITAIAYQYIKTSPNTKNPVTIYIGHTNKATFTSTTDWVPVSQMTEVFYGPLTFNNTFPWFNINFSESFFYEGGNLVVAVLNNHGSYDESTPTFRTHSAGANRTLHYRVDGTSPINPVSPPTGTELLTTRSNTRFITCPVLGSYTVYRDGELLVSGYKKKSYLDEAFDSFEPHTWSVVLVCEEGEISAEESVTLEPCQYEGDCASPAFLNVEYQFDCSVELNWGGGKGKSTTEKPRITKVYTEQEIDYDKEAMETNRFNASQSLLRMDPNPTQQYTEFMGDDADFIRGLGSDVYFGKSDGAVRKGTVGNPFPGTSVGSNGAFLQTFEYINGEIYAVRWNAGNQLGKINMATGAWTTVGSIANCDGASLCYNPANGLTYLFPFTGAESEGQDWGTINLQTGALTVLGNMGIATGSTYFVAINNEGVAFAHPMGTNQFGTINLTTGAFTSLTTTPFTTQFIQNMSFDRETGLLYWMAVTTASTTTTYFYEIDVNTLTFTLKGNDGNHWLAFTTITEPGTPCPTISNLTATQNGADVNLGWSAATGGPTGYEVRCDGNLLTTITATSYTHIGPNPGMRNYCVRAIYPASNDCIPQSVCQSVLVNEMLGDNCQGAVVGTATTAYYQVPLNTFWGFSYVQHIYDAAELEGNEGKEMTGIAFEYIHTATDTKSPVTIYIGHTNKNTFGGTSDWVPVSEMTEVYHGSLTLTNALPWFTITFDNPFMYQGGNLVVAVLNNHGSYLSSSNTFRYHNATGKTLHYRKDNTPVGPINPVTPPTASGVIAERANTRFTFCQNLYNIYRDGALIASEHAGTTYVDNTADPFEEHTWCVTAICSNGWESLPYTCATKAPCSQPPPCNNCIVGTDATTGYQVPLNTYYNFSLVQQIYDASEMCDLTAANPITAISFQYIHNTCNVDKTIVLYLGNTAKSTFATTSDWVPVDQMEMVFSGVYTLVPNQDDSWVTIEFQTPFYYTGGNIVVAMNNITGSYACTSSNPTFRYHVATGNKTLHAYKDATPAYNPAAPGTGNLTVNRSNIKFSSCEQLERDMAAISINGHYQPVADVEYTYNVVIRNNGINTETDYAVKVYTSNNVEIGHTDDVPALAPNQVATVPVKAKFSESMIGDLCIKGSVLLVGDQVPVNNSTPFFCVTVRPFSEDDVIDIPKDPWVGTLQNSIPFNFLWNSSMTQSVYLSSEMGIPGGFIKELSWFYNNTGTALTKPVKVWLANTSESTLPNAWLSDEHFTLVYEGNVSIPLGLYQLTIPLTEENYYLYSGGNLVVKTERILDAPWFGSVNAFATAVTPTPRTRHYYSDTAPFNGTQLGNTMNTVSNIELVVRRVPFGVVKGTIKTDDCNVPLSGVMVTLNKYGLTAYTNDNGEYVFPFVPEGTDYALTATKYLYYDEFAGPFNVEANQEYIFDFCMSLRDGYIVYGAVQGSDETYIEGATLKLEGYADYAITSGINGTFEFVGVLWAKDYTLTVTAPGWAKHTSKWDISGNTNMGTIILYDITFPPSNVIAEDINDLHAHIYWEEPIPATATTYILDDGSAENGLTINPNFNRWLGNKFEVGESGVLTSLDIYWMANPSSTNKPMTVDIFNASQQLVNTSDVFYTPGDAWLNIPLNDVPYSETFYAMVHWEDAPGMCHYVGLDENGPNHAKNFDMRYDGSSWSVAHIFYEAAPYVFMIRANAMVDGKSASYGYKDNVSAGPVQVQKSSNSKAEITLANRVSIAPELIRTDRASKGIVGYRLWRLLPGQESDESVWASLTNIPVPAMEYNDYSWATTAPGTYKWAVRTSYHMGVESAPAFSNNLVKVAKSDYVINVTTNSGDSPAGAEVTLSNSTNTYSGVIEVNTITFNSVVHGTYNLKVTLAGYNDYTAQIVVTGPDVHLATLIEIIKNPFGLEIEVDECAALFTWDHELAGGKHLNDFNVYLNDVLKAEGVKTTEYLFVGLAKGEYTAGVQAVYSSGVSNIVTLNFEIEKDCEGVDVIEQAYRIYPNPASNHIIIHRDNATFATIEIFNAMGMHIATYETNEVQYEINVTDLSAATYFIKVTDGANSSVKSFVKK